MAQENEIDRYVFKLILDSSGFRKGEAQALRSMKNIKGRFATIANVAAGAIGIMVTAASAGVKEFITFNTEIAKFSRRVGENQATIERWERSIKRIGANKQSIFSDIEKYSLMMNTRETRNEMMKRAIRLGVPSEEAHSATSATQLLESMDKYARILNPIKRDENGHIIDAKAYSSAMQEYGGLSSQTVDFFLRIAEKGKTLQAYLQDQEFKPRMNEEDAKAAEEAAEAFNQLKDALNDIVILIGQKITPQIVAIRDILKDKGGNKGWRIWKVLAGLERRKDPPPPWWKLPFAKIPDEYLEEYGIGPDSLIRGGKGTAEEMQTLETAIAASLAVQTGASRFLRGREPMAKGASSKVLKSGMPKFKNNYNYITDWEYDRYRELFENPEAREIFSGGRFGSLTGKQMAALPDGLNPATEYAAKQALGKAGEGIFKVIEDPAFARFTSKPITFSSTPLGIAKQGIADLDYGGLFAYAAAGGAYINSPWFRQGSTPDISPQYNITVNATNTSPAAITDATKRGVTEANYSLAGTLSRSMDNKIYHGPSAQR